MDSVKREADSLFTVDIVGIGLYLIDRLRLIALVTAAFLVAGCAYAAVRYSVVAGQGYQADARLSIQPYPQTLLYQLQRYNPKDTLVSECLNVAKSRGVKTEAAQAAGIDISSTDLGWMMTASQVGSTRVITLTARAATADGTSRLIDEYARVAMAKANAMYAEDSHASPVSIAVQAGKPHRFVDTVDENGVLIHLRAARNAIVFFTLLGFASACVFLFARCLLDKSVRSPAEALRETGLSTLGVLPYDSTGGSAYMESAGSIASAVIRAQLSGVKAVMVTGCRSGSGKTYTAKRLLESAALAGLKTVLLDADLSGSTLAAYCGAQPGTDGMEAYLANGWDDNIALYSVGLEGASVAPVATHVQYAMPLLSGGRFAQLIDYLKRTHDLVLVDSPDVDPTGAAAAIARQCGAAVIVVELGKASRTELRAASDVLAQSSCTPLGIVFNKATFERFSRRIYYFREYHDWVAERFGKDAARVLRGSAPQHVSASKSK